MKRILFIGLIQNSSDRYSPAVQKYEKFPKYTTKELLKRNKIRIFAKSLVMNTQIFEQIRQLKREIMPNEKLILFGSQARGDARPDSDWDLLAVVDKEKRNFSEDFDKYAYPFDELGLNSGVCITTIVRTKKDWESKPSLLKYNVEREGIEIK